MHEVAELFSKTQTRAEKFAGRQDLAALAEIAGTSYIRARDRAGRLILAMQMHGKDDNRVTQLSHELEEAENRLTQALVEYAAVMRALGTGETAARIAHKVEAEAQMVNGQIVRITGAPALAKLRKR